MYETEISGQFVIIETKDQSSVNQICGKVHAFCFSGGKVELTSKETTELQLLQKPGHTKTKKETTEMISYSCIHSTHCCYYSCLYIPNVTIKLSLPTTLTYINSALFEFLLVHNIYTVCIFESSFIIIADEIIISKLTQNYCFLSLAHILYSRIQGNSK